MKGNTLYKVSDQVNPQDVATKEYADNVVEGRSAIWKLRRNRKYMRGYTLTNVLDPADAQDVATKQYVMTNKALIFGEGRYMATDDLSMGCRRLNNVGMPMENHQASNEFYVNTVVEFATSGDRALTRTQDGSFAMAGEINMSGNSITGLPNAIDRNAAAANKNYVDNGGAIAKNPDGSFTAVSDIEINGFSLKNSPDPKDIRDIANKAYVDNKVSLPSLICPKPTITMWAEEKGPLGDGYYKFSYGHGSSGS